MIRSAESLDAAIRSGATISRMAEFDDPRRFRWVQTDTNEPVHGQAVRTLLKRERLEIVGRDLCGEPMQYAGAADDCG